MCGITGILRWDGNKPERAEIERMTQALVHRGPDGNGFFVQDRIAFGHRRLAIIDIEGGKQPMHNENCDVWITQNGEIYNYLELKDTLEKKGHRFITRSDTEVIIHAYEEWGLDCVGKLRGMFAFAIADFNKKRLFLCRDHFGIKPLYYRIGKGDLMFASELSALRAAEDEAPFGNLQAVEYYLRFQYIPIPHTIYRDIYKLPPASYMTVSWDGRLHGPVKYWRMTFAPQNKLNEAEYEEETRDAIYESVKTHLVSDVPFGVFMSGGVDSTLIVLAMREILGYPVKAFSIGFDKPGYSEIPYVGYLAKKIGLELHTEIIKDTSVEMLPDLIAHCGEPFGDSSIIPTWYVSRLARSYVPMVLSGDGGDEGFAGYQSYLSWMLYDPWKSFLESLGTLHFQNGLRDMKYIVKFRMMNRTRNNIQEWQHYILCSDSKTRLTLWNHNYHPLVLQSCELFEEMSKNSQKYDRLAYAQYLDYGTYLPSDILPKVDVASMYHGLEVRTPLIDLRVVELLTRLPLFMRFRQSGLRQPAGKYVLKKILLDYFGEDFFKRKKYGFSIPRVRWFLPGQAGRQMLEDFLLDHNSKVYDWFNSKFIRNCIDSHSENCDNSNILWLLLVLNIWLAQNRKIVFR